MELQVQKRLAIVKATGQKLKEEKDKEGPLLARILGVTPEELQQLNALSKESIRRYWGKLLTNTSKTQPEALDAQIEAQQEKLDLACRRNAAAGGQGDSLGSKKLATATVWRLERLIGPH